MAKIDLQSDEIVIMENKNFSVRSIPLDAIITNRRLILVDSKQNVMPQRNIPLAAIHSIDAEENADKDQIVTLTLLTEDGNQRQMILTLLRQAGIERKWEYDEWVRNLKERNLSATAAQISRRDAPGMAAQEQQCAKSGGDSSCIKSRDAVPDYIPYVPKSPESPPPEKAPKRSPFITIGAIILVILVIICAVVVVGQFTKGKAASPADKGIATVITTSASPVPTPSPTILEVTQTIVLPVTTAPPQYLIPKSGTWVRVQYPGNFVGNVGVRGNLKPLNNTYEEWIQISAAGGMIEGSIEKQDGSTDNLIVGIYKDGALVYNKTTRTPHGVLDLHYTL